MSCAAEHSHSHGGHSHGGGGEHNHDEDDVSRGELFSLFSFVDAPRVRCLNAAESGMGAGVFRAWDRRMETGDGTFIESDEDDRELLLHVPFTASVKIRALVVIGGGAGSSPARVKLFVNNDNLDFAGAAETKPLQEIELVEDSTGRIEYPLKPAAKFASVRSLTFYFEETSDDEDMAARINFIGLKGDFERMHHRREAVIATYESRAQQQDHETPAEDFRSSHLGH